MTTKTFVLIFAMAILMATMSACRPKKTCIDFEPPLALGTKYGSPASQPPGTVIFTTNGIPVSIHGFSFSGGGGTFNYAEIENPPVAFSTGQCIHTNNVNLEFDLHGARHVRFEFLDLGGIENLSVNGSAPIYVGELSAAPTSIGGATLSVTTTPVTGGKKGTAVLKGAINQLRVGGQEFWMDHVCSEK